MILPMPGSQSSVYFKEVEGKELTVLVIVLVASTTTAARID